MSDPAYFVDRSALGEMARQSKIKWRVASPHVLTAPKIGGPLDWDDRPTHRGERAIDSQQIRDIIRDEFSKDAAKRAAAAMSPWMTLEETAAHLKMSIAAVYDLRCARRAAKGEWAKARAFAPDHGTGKLLRFHRTEIDAWQKAN